MARNITTGIDIGTNQVKVVVTENNGNNNLPKIIGTGFSQSKGLRHGYIINQNDTIKSIILAIKQAEKITGIKIKKAFISIGGIGLEEVHSNGGAVVARADSEITDLDIEKAVRDGEKKVAPKMANRKILHEIPLEYKIDGQKVLGKPKGMRGSKLEIKTFFITCLEQHLNDLISAVEDAGIEVEDVIASPLAGSFVTLTQAQKVAGSILANIGAETVSIVIFENNMPISLKVFPTGGTDITNDIALGLKIPLDQAEQVKTGALSGIEFSQKKLDEIISARLMDIFELIEAHLKKMGKNELLPAGIVITGGGSGIATIEDIARVALKLPSKIFSGYVNGNGSTSVQKNIRDSSWAVAYGLCIWGLSAEGGKIGITKQTTSGILQSAKQLLSWTKQFLP